MVLCYSDDIRGGNLGLMYNLLLHLDQGGGNLGLMYNLLHHLDQCVHTNMKLEQCLDLYETGLIPWDIEMTVEDDLSDDEDGSHHSVSDFDSESESEKDSDYIVV